MPAGIGFIYLLSINEIIVLFKQHHFPHSYLLGSTCPPPCHTPVPVECAAGEVWCDAGSTAGWRDKETNICLCLTVSYFQDVAMAIPACRQAQSAHMSAISQLQQFVQQGRFGATMAATMAALLGATVCLQVLFAHQFATPQCQLFVETGKYLVMEEVQMDVPI